MLQLSGVQERKYADVAGNDANTSAPAIPAAGDLHIQIVVENIKTKVNPNNTANNSEAENSIEFVGMYEEILPMIS